MTTWEKQLLLFACNLIVQLEVVGRGSEIQLQVGENLNVLRARLIRLLNMKLLHAQ